jgi:hypothetical protein
VPAGAGAFEVVGWIFSAKDLASAVVLKAEHAIAKAADGIGGALKGVADKAAFTARKIGQSWKDFGPKFSETWKELGPTVESASTLLANFGLKKIPEFLNSVKATGDALKTAFDEKKFLTAFSVLVKGIRETGAIQAVMRVAGERVKKVGESIFFLGRKAAGAAVQVNSLFQKFLSLKDVQMSMGGEGIASFFGPLKGIFRLLTPIINLVSKIFAPLIEGISAHLENVLGPLQMTMEMIAQNIGPKLAKLLVPIVTLIEIMVTQAGVFIDEMLEGGTLAGPLVKGVMDIIPSVMKLFGAIGATVVKILPVFLRIFQLAVPIVAKVVEHVAEFAADLLPKLGDIIAKVGPKLIDAFAKTLDALIPILPALAKLAIVLVDKVFAPAMVKTLLWLANWMSDDLIPFIEKWLPALVIVIEDIATKVDKFFGNFDKYMSDFNELFLKPLKEGINEILAMFGLGDLQSQWDKMTKAFMAPLETLKSGINALIIDPINQMLAAELFGKSLGKALDIEPFKFLAEGGIVTGPVQGIVGEAGPELVMPLTPDTMGMLLDPVVTVLERIDFKLGGVLRVDSGDTAGGQASRSSEGVNLLDAIGISGVT